MAGIALAVIALARPQERNVIREQFAEGVDIMMVLDTSTSMRAQDFQPNRFEAAKEVGADAYCVDAGEGVRVAKRCLAELL